MNECEKYREMISAMLDGELDAGERERLIAHLSSCAGCRELYELLSSVSGSEAWELPEVPEGLHGHIMSGVKSAASVRKKEGLMRRFRPLALAAACLVLIVGVVFGVPRVFRMGSSGGSGSVFNTTAAANSNSAPAAAQDNAGIDTAAPAEVYAGNAEPAKGLPISGSSDDAPGDINHASNSQSGTPEADAEGAPVPEPEAAPGEPEKPKEPELDIERSVVTVESGGKSVSEKLNRDDTLIWLRAIIDGTAGERIVAAKLEVFRSEGADYEVYFYHDGGKLMGSLTEDQENGIELKKLADFAQFEEMADSGE